MNLGVFPGMATSNHAGLAGAWPDQFTSNEDLGA